MKRLKIRKSTKQYITVALISVVIVSAAALAAYLVSVKKLNDTYEAKLTAANEEMKRNQRKVYVAAKEIMAGTIISKENTKEELKYASQPANIYIDSSDLGKTALVDLAKDTQITKAVVTETGIISGLREVVYGGITISSYIRHKDTVDIRLLYPNGENYIVLSKKRLLKEDGAGEENKGDGTLESGSIGEEATAATEKGECYFWLTEEEILRMSSAIVDAYLYQGSQLYTAEYIEPVLQEASIVNYTPSLAAIKLIREDPNIVETASEYLSNIVRQETENRLAQSMNAELSDVNRSGEKNLAGSSNSAEAGGNYYYEQEGQEKNDETEY